MAGGAAEVGIGVDVGTGVRVGAGRVAPGPEVAAGAVVAAGAEVGAGAVVAAGAEVAAGAVVGRGVAVAAVPQAAMNSSSRTAEVNTMAREKFGRRCRIVWTSLGSSIEYLGLFPAGDNHWER